MIRAIGRGRVSALALCCLAVGSAEAAKFKVETHTDSFTGAVTVQTSGNAVMTPVPGESKMRGLRLLMNPRYSVEASAYILIVIYSGPDWIFIREGASLLVKADEELIKLTLVERDSTTTSGGGVVEVAAYHPERADLDRMVAASDVRIRLSGKRRTLERVFDAENKANYRQFLAAVTDLNTTP